MMNFPETGFPIGAQLIAVRKKSAVLSKTYTFVLVFEFPQTGEIVEKTVWATSP